MTKRNILCLVRGDDVKGWLCGNPFFWPSTYGSFSLENPNQLEIKSGWLLRNIITIPLKNISRVNYTPMHLIFIGIRDKYSIEYKGVEGTTKKIDIVIRPTFFSDQPKIDQYFAVFKGKK